MTMRTMAETDLDRHSGRDRVDVTHNYAVVTAVDGLEKFPMKTAYKHLHYGKWNSLDA